MKARLLLTLKGLAIGSMLPRVLIVALLTGNSNAASLQPSETRQKGEDLQVITLDSQGYRAKTLYYSYDQLLTLPTVTVKTERDPNTNTPATYTGIYISDLFEAFGADTSFDVIGAKCSNGQKQYYDRNYVARHRPIFLLKLDGKPPADWPSTEHGWLGPYCVVHESFSPAETVYGYVEQPRTAPGVFSLELTSFDQSLGRFTPKQGGNDPEVLKGQKIAVGSCISCHNLGNAGGGQGREGDTSWAVLAERAVNSRDNFRKKVTDPISMNPTSHMPPHPEFDDNTFNALEAYFKAMTAIE
jgi:mono/diheme cytochrome c family protein